MKISTRLYHSICGTLLLGGCGDVLCLCDWLTAKHRQAVDDKLKRVLGATFTEETSPLLEKAAEQLDEYFAGKRREFELPLLLIGTEFQQSVWRSLRRMPYGETISYAEIAMSIGSPKAARAAANAIGANPISIFVPCHRVLGSHHTLTGYAGGLEAKRTLLIIEGILPTKLP